MPTINKQTNKPAPQLPPSLDSDDAWAMIDRITLLLYGRSGTGKTRFWGTFPGKTLALICSGGKKPGELRSIATPENRARITAKIVRSMGAVHDLLATADQYTNVVLDHVSGLTDLSLKEVLGLEELPSTKEWGLLTGDHYKQSNRQVIEVCRALLNTSGNVIIIGQERTFGGGEDTNISAEIIKPAVSADTSPGVAKWLAPSCDYVCNTYIRPKFRTTSPGNGQPEITVREKGVEYCLRVEPNDVYAVKFRRVGNAPLTDIVDPTYAKFMAAVRGEQAKRK